MRNVTIVLAVLAVAAMAVPAEGTSIFWRGYGSFGSTGTKVFHTDSNWSDPPGRAPSQATDNAVFDWGADCEITLDTAIEGISLQGRTDTTTDVYQLSGAVSTSYPISIGSYYSGVGSVSTYTISGGSMYSVRGILVGDKAGVIGNFTIDNSSGSPLSIDTHKYTQNDVSTLKVILDSSGYVTPIAVEAKWDYNSVLAGTLRLEYGTGYVPQEDDTVTVLTFTTDNGESLDYSALSLDADDSNWQLVHGGSSAIVVEYIPEPATMVLLGIGGIGVLLRRKRR